MTDEEILAEFRAAKALLDGHFILSSGLRSPRYLQCARVLMHPARAERLARALADKLPAALRDSIDFQLRRGFSLDPGTKALMVEDVVTTGLSSREAIEAVREAGGDVIAEAALVDRSSGKADLGVPFYPLIRIDVPTYSAEDLPPELAAIPPIKPGSRAAA
jgi:orotate phosphoribosyltransferase